ncbi:hypothetical protein DFS34DRAFT_441623 [Phlyctochytrium arcticum]|nr:hypothetical protein DFS34DRAFT_441623 [Phlyctochytrium arcticum]
MMVHQFFHDAVKNSKILWLQVLLYFHKIYFPFFWVATLILLLFKARTLPSASTTIGFEFFGWFALALYESWRYALASRIFRKKSGVLLLSIIFAILALPMYLYVAVWQTHACLLDVLFVSISLIFIFLELGAFLLISLI